MDIDIKIQDEELKRKLTSLQKKLKNLRPILLEVGNMVRNDIEQAFEREQSPFGQRWQPLAVFTVLAGVRGRLTGKKGRETKQTHNYLQGRKILTASGQLGMSFTVKADSDSVTVGTNKVYARIHHFGGKAGRGRRTSIPARPFLPVSKSGQLEPSLQKGIIRYIERKLEE
ncbi:phage virion morphogenesis protein [Geovibrio ferrireducens]|uniref:phage virion morphogenesis protein n=1 Tax=Geovibrio ferrireducens TaxID=46201 RepID=UPI002245E412|nr:phage virion morphogenesis protein [Geovibrio ferrireducens]